MIIDRRRILGGFAVFSLVLLRLVIGWHFLGEGLEKVEYDRHDGELHLAFSADTELLNLAKGPLAPLYLAHTPSNHEWRALLASPRENVPKTPEQIAEQTKWVREYSQRQKEAKAKGTAAPVEFVPGTATHDWATKVAEDWRAATGKFKAIAGLTADQLKAADAALERRLGELEDFVLGAEQEVAEFRHEVWRLANWKASPEAGGVPFYTQRIATKNGENTSKIGPWREEVKTIEEGLGQDFDAILTSEQKIQAGTLAAADEALADVNQHKLNFINMAATVVTIGVGFCLIFGLFTRLAAIVGALFLFGVIASQPFWVTGTAPTINQCVELAALLVLAGTGAGHWAGMDGCFSALFGRRRYVGVVED